MDSARFETICRRCDVVGNLELDGGAERKYADALRGLPSVEIIAFMDEQIDRVLNNTSVSGVTGPADILQNIIKDITTYGGDRVRDVYGHLRIVYDGTDNGLRRVVCRALMNTCFALSHDVRPLARSAYWDNLDEKEKAAFGLECQVRGAAKALFWFDDAIRVENFPTFFGSARSYTFDRLAELRQLTGPSERAKAILKPLLMSKDQKVREYALAISKGYQTAESVENMKRVPWFLRFFGVTRMP